MPEPVEVGRFIAVVGPSGVGKDSVMNALCDRLPDLVRVRRVITRDPEAGGEDYEPVTEEAFKTLDQDGAFCLSWQAHGLFYGLPASVHDTLEGGQSVIANLSRKKLSDAAALFPRFTVLSLTADPKVLAERLAVRGRESAEDRQLRLSRAALDLPEGLASIEIDNSGTIDRTIARAVAALGELD